MPVQIKVEGGTAWRISHLAGDNDYGHLHSANYLVGIASQGGRESFGYPDDYGSFESMQMLAHHDLRSSCLTYLSMEFCQNRTTLGGQDAPDGPSRTPSLRSSATKCNARVLYLSKQKRVSKCLWSNSPHPVFVKDATFMR